MAGSRYEYVRKFELLNDVCLLNTWMVVRLDGRGFSRFTKAHSFVKPNDIRGLGLMNSCAIECMKEFPDIAMAYGQSDEFSFVLRKGTKLFNRRSSKIMSCLVSLFSANYAMSWSKFMPETKLETVPHFDARVVMYPAYNNLQDYFAWRQVDCHVNNLYNTCFWNLVNVKGLTNVEAQTRLDGTLSGEKNELLFSEFDINYNNENPMFRKGSVILRELVENDKKRLKRTPVVKHIDIISDPFWKENAAIFE